MLAFYLALIDEPSDKEKFEKIYHSYKNMMFKVALSVLHNNSLAEEAVQESFMKILRNFNKISEPVCSKTASFIVIIVRNTSLDILRKEQPDDYVSYDDDINVAGSIEMPDIENVLSESGMGVVMEIITNMDKIYSDILKLKYIYGFDNTEIAEILNITEKNVNIRIFRAKKILREKLEENGYEVK